jgi:hypothetical protein
MRHWIIAVLALQFFCSLGIGALQQPLNHGQTAVVSEPMPDDARATSAHGWAESVADASVLDREHDLLDEIPDLPDGLDPWPLGLAARSAWGRTPPHLNPHSPSPSLEGLQRPPQA